MGDHRARHMVTVLGHRFPDLWRTVDMFREKRGTSLPMWPAWCFLPLHAAYAIADHVRNDESPLGTPYLASLFGALATWRVTQGIYRFDPVLYEALLATPLDRALPQDPLYRLPEWCVYIETPGMFWSSGGEMRALHGVWAHLDWDERVSDKPHHELRLLLDTASSPAEVLRPYACLPIPVILGDGSLADALQRVGASAEEQARQCGVPVAHSGQIAAEMRGLAPKLWPIVSLLLYLCAEEADGVPGGLTPPQPKRTRRGPRLFAPDAARVWEIGVRLGAALRRQYHAEAVGQRAVVADQGRSRPRAHIRRAHWHTFFAGAARAERRIRWLAPIAVNVDDLEALPSTVRPVKPDSK